MGKTTIRCAAFLWIFAFLGSSCSKRTDSQSELTYSVANKLLPKSLLRPINSTGTVRIKVNNLYPAVDHTEEILGKIKAEFSVAANKWIAPLRGYNGWHRTNATIKFVNSGPTDLIVTLDPMNRRAFANFGTMNIGAEVWAFEGLDLPAKSLASSAQYIILHELGHSMGLGDTYGAYKDGQPTSIMNGHGNTQDVPTLRGDDIAGIKVVWDHIRGTTSGCGEGYKPNGSSHMGDRLCIPDGGAGDQGGTVSSDVAASGADESFNNGCPQGQLKSPNETCVLKRDHEHCSAKKFDIFGNCVRWGYDVGNTPGSKPSDDECPDDKVESPNGTCVLLRDDAHCSAKKFDIFGNCVRWGYEVAKNPGSRAGEEGCPTDQVKSPNNTCVLQRDHDHCSAKNLDFFGNCVRWGYEVAKNPGSRAGEEGCPTDQVKSPNDTCVLRRDHDHCQAKKFDIFGNCIRWGYEVADNQSPQASANQCPAGQVKSPNDTCVLRRDHDHCQAKKFDIFGNCIRWGY